MHADLVYDLAVTKIYAEGVDKGDRTGTGTRSLFGPQMEFGLREGFPLLTKKRVPFRIIAEELFFFTRGDTDLKSLLDKDVKIWTDDGYRVARENGFTGTKEEFVGFVKRFGYSLGPIYGHQWRSWSTNDAATQDIDQLNDVIETIKNNPDDRRMLVTAWNPSDIPFMALPPCHILFQFYVANGELSCKMYQRSADFFLGVPFNIASYSLLVHLIAKMCGLKVGKFIHTFGDAHIYNNHFKAIETQLERDPRPMPQLNVKVVRDRIEDYTIDDIELIGYDPHDTIKADLSVGL